MKLDKIVIARHIYVGKLGKSISYQFEIEIIAENCSKHSLLNYDVATHDKKMLLANLVF